MAVRVCARTNLEDSSLLGSGWKCSLSPAAANPRTNRRVTPRLSPAHQRVFRNAPRLLQRHHRTHRQIMNLQIPLTRCSRWRASGLWCKPRWPQVRFRHLNFFWTASTPCPRASERHRTSCRETTFLLHLSRQCIRCRRIPGQRRRSCQSRSYPRHP